MHDFPKRALVAVLACLALALPLSAAGGTRSHDHGNQKPMEARDTRKLAGPIARARAATAEYATDLDAAKADGYRIITRMIPDMGYHFLNPAIGGFDIDEPQILVYLRDGDDWQLAALEWVFAEKPKRKPIPGATYGSFGAACHYDDGTFVFKKEETKCSSTSPETGEPFVFWHPKLVTLHLWAWYPNPHRIFNGTNRWVRPFNDESF